MLVDLQPSIILVVQIAETIIILLALGNLLLLSIGSAFHGPMDVFLVVLVYHQSNSGRGNR